jgi:hypothetical protein
MKTRQTLLGDSSDGSVSLVSANTWYQFPPSGSVPDYDYALVISSEATYGALRFSFDNGGTPSSSNGNKFSGGINVNLGSGNVIYIGSSKANDKLNWTAKGF